MKEVILFILTFSVLLLVYELFIVLKAKKNINNKSKYPAEIKYLIFKYKLDVEKINFVNLLHTVAVVSSFDMALVLSISTLSDVYLYQLIIILVLIMPVVLGSYHCIYLYYKKRGLI